MVDIYSLTIRADTRDVKRARGDLGMLSESAARASRENQKLARTSQAVAKASRFSSNGLRQTSMQLSQVAQQASATGNWVQALAIQLPDLALAFGPVGIALGAVAGGLLSYVSSANDAEEETKTLIQRIDGLSVEYDDLNESIRETLRLEKSRAEAAIEDQIAEQREQLRLAEQRVRSYNNALNATGQAGARFGGAVDPEKLQDATENVTELGGEIGFLELKLSETTKRYDEYINGTDSAAEAAEKQAEKLDQLVEGLQRQADVVGLNARETALYEAARLGANAADIEAINNSFDLIETYRKQEQARKSLIDSTKIGVGDDPLLQSMGAGDRGQAIIDELRQNAESVRNGLDEEFSIRQAHKERVVALNDALRLGVIGSTEDRNRLEAESMRRRNEQLHQIEIQKFEILDSGQQTFLSATENLFGNLASIAEKGGKDQFDTWKAMASAQAAVSTALAVANALTAAPPPVNFALAASVGALGAIQVAQIQASEFQGARQMGGSVSAGGRYLVGENGPEIVTMGGSGVVTPSSVMGTGEPSMPNITVNMIEDNARSGQVEQRRRDDGSVEINAFVSDITSGGRRAKVMESVYGLRRQGR